MSHRALVLLAAMACAGAGPITGDAAVALIAAAMERAGAGRPDMPPPMRALPPCDHDPRVTAFQGRWTAAELACDAPRAWRRVLRTGASPEPGRPAADPAPPADAMAVLVAARPLRKGALVAAGDLAAAAVNGADVAQALTMPSQALGRRLRAHVGSGQPLLERHLAPLLLVEPGQRVAVTLRAGGIAVASEGIAQGGGGLGEVVRVEVMPHGRIIEAEVAGLRNLIVRPKIR